MERPSAAEVARYWSELLEPYKDADWRRATFQLANSVLIYAGLWWLMYKSLAYGYWLTLLLAVPAAGMLIRLFIIQHDCGHGAFYRSQRLNDRIGGLIGVLMMTPYQYWRRTHARHHATSGDLDRRDLGDVETLTVREYLERGRWRRLGYRLYRNPIILFIFGPAFQFMIKHRFPVDIPRSWKKEWRSVHWTNLGILAGLLIAWQTIGLVTFLKVQLPITLFAGTIGIWLFYMQHQFEDTYWRRNPEWNFHRAGIEGASMYDLPAVLHWFTGNIGFHHIHHLSSRIPNYRLRQAFKNLPELDCVTKLTIWQSLKSLNLRLWDEDERRLVGFRHLKQLRARASG